MVTNVNAQSFLRSCIGKIRKVQEHRSSVAPDSKLVHTFLKGLRTLNICNDPRIVLVDLEHVKDSFLDYYVRVHGIKVGKKNAIQYDSTYQSLLNSVLDSLCKYRITYEDSTVQTVVVEQLLG